MTSPRESGASGRAVAETCFIRVAARVQESLPTRKFHEPVFANEVVDLLCGLLGKGGIERQTTWCVFTVQDRAIARGLALRENRTLAGAISKRLGRPVVRCS